MPVLTIVAGPNGAGKSTHSKEILIHDGIEVFDFDKEYYSIWSEFNFDPYIQSGAFDRAQALYIEKRTRALTERIDFAFESNFHTSEILSTVDLFGSKGYSLDLIFICLESPEIAIERVKDRVAKGGHSVEVATIRYRFDSGLRLLNDCFDRFDMVHIYRSVYNGVEGLAILEPRVNSVTSLAPIPDFLKSYLPNVNAFIASCK